MYLLKDFHSLIVIGKIVGIFAFFFLPLSTKWCNQNAFSWFIRNNSFDSHANDKHANGINCPLCEFACLTFFFVVVVENVNVLRCCLVMKMLSPCIRTLDVRMWTHWMECITFYRYLTIEILTIDFAIYRSLC